VSGIDLITPAGRFPLRGRLVDVAKSAGITTRPLRDVYSGGPDFSDLEPVDVAVGAVDPLSRAIINGDAALRSFAPNEDPILWPEHCDIGISVPEVTTECLRATRVSTSLMPTSVPGVCLGTVWNQPFWAARPLSELPTPPGHHVLLRGGQGGPSWRAGWPPPQGPDQPDGDRAT
jgi:hypothetical protein